VTKKRFLVIFFLFKVFQLIKEQVLWKERVGDMLPLDMKLDLFGSSGNFPKQT
jgi:hypothetical protein